MYRASQFIKQSYFKKIIDIIIFCIDELFLYMLDRHSTSPCDLCDDTRQKQYEFES